MSGDECMCEVSVAHVNFLTDSHNRRWKLKSTDILIYGWIGEKHTCMNSNEVSPTCGTKDEKIYHRINNS